MTSTRPTSSLVYVFLLIVHYFACKSHGSRCDSAFYDPVSDCSTHPLRIGYYGLSCGGLHTLTDSGGASFANLARLNHPASYVSGGVTKYDEYKAGWYLSIKLSKPAQIFGIAMQGSPNNLRYYLKSFELWYKISVNDLAISNPTNVSEGFYKENGVTKRFTGEMRTTTTFTLANAFYADEVRIYPIRFYGEKVFRTELYGCYLGRVIVPASVGVGNVATIKANPVQNTKSNGNKYYFKINEPDTTSSLISVDGSANYTFTSRGKGSIELGLNYSGGWLVTDRAALTVQGAILGLQLLLDGATVFPYKKTENADIEFRLLTSDQVYQIKKYFFSFGDGSQCTHNYCKKQYPRGIYNATGKASNDFYQTSLQAQVISCPNGALAVNYQPAIHLGGIGISYLGSAIVHNFTVQFYALAVTTYDVRINGSKTQTEALNAHGFVVKKLSLPASVTAPSQHSLFFNYTDVCATRGYTATIFLDQQVAGISQRLNQTLKDQLAVPYYFKNQPISIYVDIVSGTSILCQVSTQPIGGSKIWHTATMIASKAYMYTHTFNSLGDTSIKIGAKCWNRLNVPEVHSVETTIEVREIPEKMTNFSLDLSKPIVSTGESFFLYMIFLTGNKMNCSIISTTAGISQSLTYNQLIAYQQPHSNGRKAYRITLSTSVFSMVHRIEAFCRNVWKQLNDSVTIQVQKPVNGLTMDIESFSCYNASINVTTSVAQGAPINTAIFVDSIQRLDHYAVNGTSSSFVLTPNIYSIPGWKQIYVRSWNNVSTLTSVTKTIRIAESIETLSVHMNFTLSSPQALPNRPNFILPSNERVNFTAYVTPNSSGYLFNWKINETSQQTKVPDWSYTFSTPGFYRFQLVIDGCNNRTYEQTLTVVSQIEDFNVYSTPFPEVVVNKSISVYTTKAKQSKCVQIDFGDGTSPIIHCNSNIHCIANNVVCTDTHHVYRRPGNVTIKVTASNDLYARVKEVHLVAKTCFNPAVTIQGNGTDISEVIYGSKRVINMTYLPRSSSLFYNITSVNTNCEFGKNYSISWKIYSAGIRDSNSSGIIMWNDASFLMPNSAFVFGENNHTLRIPCCMVKYGVLSVSVNVSMIGHNNTAGFVSKSVFFMYINQSDLIAALKETGHKKYRYNTEITLNGSESRDPDMSSTDLKFAWYCRDTVLEPRDISMISNISLINATYSSEKKHSVIGCFGKSVGRIDVGSAVKTIQFNSTHLQENHTIEFTLVIEGTNTLGIRKSNVSRTLLVRTRETPYFKIRCCENCAAKLDPSAKFSLVTDCHAKSCRNADFKWSLVQHDGIKDLPMPIDPLGSLEYTDKDIYIMPNIFLPGLNYTLTLQATASDGSTFIQKYFFEANIKPRQGSCIIDPKHGVAIFSTFRINCTGWIDTELPMTYEVAHLTDLLTTVVCRQTHGSCQTILPVGENGNSSLRIRIRIYDSLGMFTEIYHTVQVTKPAITITELNNLLARLENATANLNTARLIGAISSVLNANENKSKEILEANIKVRDSSIKLLPKMLNSTSDDVIAPLIAMLAMVPSEFTQASGITATKTTITMTTNLIRSQANVIFRDLISRSKSLLAAMGMVMKSTSVNLDPNRINKNETNVTENPLKWMTADGKSIITSTSVVLDSLVNTVFLRLSPVEAPIDILTANLGMVLKKMHGSAMNSTTSRSVLGGKVVLPSLENLHVNSSLVISSMILSCVYKASMTYPTTRQMKVTTFNSFFWAPTSNVINSSVVEYNLRSDNLILGVKDTLKPIQLYIPRTLPTPLKFQHWLFQERENEKRVNHHKLKVENDNSFHIEFKPMNYCSNFQIYVKYNSRPSKSDYNRNWTLPDLSSCNQTGLQDVIRANICSIYQELVDSSLRYQYNGSKTNFNCSLKALLETKVKQITSQCSLDPYRVFMSDSETRNGTYFVGIYDYQGSISTQSSPLSLFNDSRKCQVADYVGETSYHLRSYTTKCRFWDPSKAEDWETQGCQVAMMTDSSKIHCKCNHLTSFGGDLFIPPNEIDIDKVVAGFKNIRDNLSVVILISVLLGLFVMLLVYLRKIDRNDSDKVGVIVLNDDTLTKTYEYLVITVTGARINAGTTANVFCSLNTETKSGEPRLLCDPEKQAFQRDQINAFRIAFEEPIGDITDLRIWHDNHGSSPGWYLSRVYIEDLHTSKNYSFICEQWLAVELEDGLIDRTLAVAGSEDYKVFKHIFTTKAAEDFSDQHLWLSVVLKRPHDSFTRVQRVACCMALLCTTMLTSAMFFQLGKDSKYLWKIGSLVIDFKGIIIGIQAGLIVIPVNAVIVVLFRKTESFEHFRKRSEVSGQQRKRKKLLPYGFIFIAWFLSTAAVISSLVVVLFYSMQWGDAKSKQFVLSVFTGFFQSAFVIQPLKLVFIALILATLFKKSSDETDVLEIYKHSENQTQVSEYASGIEIPHIPSSPLTKDQLQYARKRRLMEVRLRLFVQDLISYLIFLTFLVFVVRGYRDPDAYNFSKALTDDVIHEHFNNIQDVPGLWGWVQNHFIPAIYTQTWYNGDNFTNHRMLRNQEAFRIGLSRIRQLRVKPGTCKLDEDVAGIIPGCNDYYSLILNQNKDFDIAWKPLGSARKKRSLQDDYDYEDNDVMEGMHSGTDEVPYDDSGKVRNELFDELLHNQDLKKAGTDKLLMDPSGIANDESATTDQRSGFSDYNGFNKTHLQDSSILKRGRRALKFKIKRKTIPSSSLKSHSNEVDIDSQYLLPNGRVRPNKDHWKYNDASKLRGFPYYGKFALYSGGGYVASLATEIDYARAVAMALEQDSWIDTLTRAVFFEFSVYNANLNFFATGFIIVEVLPTGAIVPSPSVRVFRLYRYVGTFGKLVMASEIILVLALFYFIYKDCRHLYRIGVVYFKQFWSWVEITIAVALFAALILRGFSWYEADKILTLLKKDVNQFINFQYVSLADDSLLLAVTIICFASTIKILKIISIFPTVVVLRETIGRCGKPLASYALPFVILFSAFAVFGSLLFWNVEMFSTYMKTIQTQLLMLIGGSVFNTLKESNDIFGPIFFILFAAFETIVFMNVFLAIINSGISESLENEQQKEKINEFIAFIEERTRTLFRIFPAEKLKSFTHQESSRRERKLSRRETLMLQRKSTVQKAKRDSRFEALRRKKTVERKVTLAYDNCDWALERLEQRIDKNHFESITEYHETIGCYVKLVLGNKETQVTEL